MNRGKLFSRCRPCGLVSTATLSLCGLLLVFGVGASAALSRPLAQPQEGSRDLTGPENRTAFPVFESRLLYANRVWFALTTWGVLGTEGNNRVSYKDRDALSINYSPSFEFPAGTRNSYMYGGALWVGGIVGNDTLVSMAMNGLSAPRDEWNAYDTISESSSNPLSPYYDPDAHADQQYFIRIYDTLVLNRTDELDVRPHIPLNLEVSQTCYAWADQALEDFVIVEYWIRNIGTEPIAHLAAGVYLDADVMNQNQESPNPFADDVSGLVQASAHPLAPALDEPLDVAWIADGDGDPVGGTFFPYSPTGAIGLRMLHTPPIEDIAFNWWLIGGTAAQDWGPVLAGARTPAPGGGIGSPLGDRNCYYVMTNGEIDYDQYTAYVDHTGQGWKPRLLAGGCGIAYGLDARLLLSAGPVCNELLPGDSIPFVIALMGGEGLHADPQVTFNCDNPYPYMASLDFGGLERAARWAAWMYDAPGVDTDGDGYRGEYVIVNGDTVFTTGDMGAPARAGGDCGPMLPGGPDFIRPEPPPCPELQLDPQFGGVVVRWDGRFSETARDVYLQRPDFQGYRVYVSPTGHPDSYSLVGSWDIGDYARGQTGSLIQRVGMDSIVIGDGQVLRYGRYVAELTDLSPVAESYIAVTAYDSGADALGLNPLESPVGSCYTIAPPMGNYVGPSVIDVSPGQCPNWLAPSSTQPLRRAVPNGPSEEPPSQLTVAVLGRDTFDVRDLALSSIHLENCPPISKRFADVSSPVIRETVCDCWNGGPDGLTDLVLIFDRAELVSALGSMARGEQVTLTLTGTTTDGALFTGQECVTIGSFAVGSTAAEAMGRERVSLRSYPNPFNAASTISYSLPQTEVVSVEIFDILGRMVTTLVDEVQTEGPHSITWNGNDSHGVPLPSGTYLCRLRANGADQSLKLLLLK